MQDISLNPDGLSQAKDFLPLLPFSRTTLWRKCNDGKFPKGIRLNANLTVWRNQDILDYIANPSKWECLT